MQRQETMPLPQVQLSNLDSGMTNIQLGNHHMYQQQDLQ